MFIYSSVFFILSSVLLICSVFLNGQSLECLIQNRKAGVLLLDMGETTAIKKRIAWGVWWFLVGLTGVMTFYHLWHFKHPTETDILNPEFFYWGNFVQWSVLAFWWSQVIRLLILCLSSKLEIRENGIYGAGTVIEWHRIKSYRWDSSKPNRLIIRVKRRSFTIPPGKLNISADYREDVDRILEEYVPDKRRP